MNNLLVLYNPYYEKDVIQQHVDILLNHDEQTKARVAFGKVRSKLRDYEHPFKERLQEIYDSVSPQNYLQLFLTDYSNLYVAKVVEVTNEDRSNEAPAYYKEKSLEVEEWFIISDIRSIAQNDFEFVRDKVLANFTTPNFDNHHYAVYGNKYVYPLVVEMDEEIEYFETDNEEFRYFTEIFKSKKTLEVKKALIRYRFGEDIFYAFHPNTQEALVSAEIEFEENEKDLLYDFTAVAIKLSKAFEKEVYLFLRKLFVLLMEQNSELSQIAYTVQGHSFTLGDYATNKPNLGTNKYLLFYKDIKDAIYAQVQDPALRHFILKTIPQAIKLVQPVRNEAAHGERIAFEECKQLRDELIGIGRSGVLCGLVGGFSGQLL